MPLIFKEILMALHLQKVKGGFADDNIFYLSGSGAPGGDAGFQDDAPQGSVYEDIDVPVQYTKLAPGTGTDKWAITVAEASRVLKSINQVGHGFSGGEWVYIDAAGYVSAQADDAATSDAIGIVNAVSDVDNFDVVTSGYSDQASGETDGTPLYLSDAVAGGTTIVKPTTGVQKNLGFVADGLIFVGINITMDIADDDAPGVPYVITSGITSLVEVDSVPVDDYGFAMWVLQADKDGGRYISTVIGGHDGTSAADATESDWQEFNVLEFGTEIADLSLGIDISGTGAGQILRLIAASTDSVDIKARRIAG